MKNIFAAIGAEILLGYKLLFNSQIGLRAYGDSNFNFSGIEHCKLTNVKQIGQIASMMSQ